jgi:hypothetical protein
MRTYENAYFGLRIDVPDRWNLVSWKHVKIGRPGQSAYQTRDDELPAPGACPSKFLFTAALYSAESVALIDADLEISVFRVEMGEDFRSGLIKNIELRREGYASGDFGMVTSIIEQGTWWVDGIDFGFVDEETKSRTGHSRYRFFFRHVADAHWLYGKVAGHKKPDYQEAVRIVEAMRCHPGGAEQTAPPDRGQ